jgi:hypothetical protein
VFAYADMVHIFWKGRRCDKVEGDISLCDSLHQQLRRQLVTEFVGFLAFKLDLLLHMPWNNELICIIYWSKGTPSVSHQTGQSHLRAHAVQFAQLFHNLRRRPRWAVLKSWAITEKTVFEVGGWVVSQLSWLVRVLLQ